MRVMALFQLYFLFFFFAKYLRVGEDGPGRGHLCHIDTFLVLLKNIDALWELRELTLNPLGFSPLWFEHRSGHMWESQVLLTDGQVVFLRVLRFSPTFDERSARYKWNILERAVKPKSKKKKKKKKKKKSMGITCFNTECNVKWCLTFDWVNIVRSAGGLEPSTSRKCENRNPTQASAFA